jgi:hypothetical protein
MCGDAGCVALREDLTPRRWESPRHECADQRASLFLGLISLPLSDLPHTIYLPLKFFPRAAAEWREGLAREAGSNFARARHLFTARAPDFTQQGVRRRRLGVDPTPNRGRRTPYARKSRRTRRSDFFSPGRLGDA